ncbi:universal stress protein [Geoalkalibacter sp.]|uniref:universal stress protein n=1 Tax=Geoalkalibacter sp. TaxID=3041440 RepID=UPI00272E73B1|nr:universal stress protein [Geoalkalibacter sp.]
MKKRMKILVPLDFSKYSLETLGFALGLRDHFDASYHLLYVVVDGEIEYFSPLAGVPRDEQRRKMDEALHQLEQEAARVRESAPGVRVEAVVLAGIPYKEICRYADKESMDLIVIGTHGRTGLSHLLIGSTTERVVQQASCPVLSIKPSIL